MPRDADRLHAEIEELFADLWRVPRFSGLRRGFRPPVDCFRTDDPPELRIVVELAGVEASGIELLAIGQERSVRLIDDVVGDDRLLALVTVKNLDPEVPGWDDLCDVGVAAVVHKLIRVPDGTLRILVQGVRRIALVDRIRDDPYLV